MKKDLTKLVFLFLLFFMMYPSVIYADDCKGCFSKKKKKVIKKPVAKRVKAKKVKRPPVATVSPLVKLLKLTKPTDLKPLIASSCDLYRSSISMTVYKNNFFEPENLQGSPLIKEITAALKSPDVTARYVLTPNAELKAIEFVLKKKADLSEIDLVNFKNFLEKRFAPLGKSSHTTDCFSFMQKNNYF